MSGGSTDSIFPLAAEIGAEGAGVPRRSSRIARHRLGRRSASVPFDGCAPQRWWIVSLGPPPLGKDLTFSAQRA